jgi:hypothetical protein
VSLPPVMGRAVLACGTMAVCAGMRALRVVLAGCTARDVTAKRCCPTVFDRLHGLHLAGPHLVCAFGPIRWAVQADDLRARAHHRSSMSRWLATQAISGAWRVRWVERAVVAGD